MFSNKKKRHFCPIGFVLLCFALPGFSQSPDTLIVDPESKAMVLANRLEREINLNPQQKEQVYTVLLERSDQWKKQV